MTTIVLGCLRPRTLLSERMLLYNRTGKNIYEPAWIFIYLFIGDMPSEGRASEGDKFIPITIKKILCIKKPTLKSKISCNVNEI